MPPLFIQVEVTADPALFDDLIGLMSSAGFNGFWEDQSVLRCFMQKDRWMPACLEELQIAARSIAGARALAAPRFDVSTLEDRNWNAEWEATIGPLRVTDRIMIAPSWHRPPSGAAEIILTIDPKMSFGTGHHETTRMVLKLMERMIPAGARALDIGTGTGILAIAAIRLGASSAIALDNDAWAVGNARENVRINGVGHAVTVVGGELSDLAPGQFDLITANLQRDVIESLIPALRDRLTSNGVLILSGLLAVDAEPVRAALAANALSVVDSLAENEWLAYAVTPFSATAGSATPGGIR